MVMNNMAIVYEKTKRMDLAQEFYSHCYHTRKTKLGVDNRSTLEVSSVNVSYMNNGTST